MFDASVSPNPLGTMDCSQWVSGLASAQALPSQLLEALLENGLLDPRRLAVLGSDSDEELGCMVAGIMGWDPESEQVQDTVLHFRALLEEVQGIASKAHRASSAVPTFDRAAAVIVAGQTRLKSLSVQAMKAVTPKLAVTPPSGLKWPTRRAQALARAGDSKAAREEVEDTERGRWAMKLFKALKDAGAPSVEGMPDDVGMTVVRRRFAKGLRASTLRAKVRTAVKVALWTERALGTPWLSSSGDLCTYLADRADEPCARSVFGTVRAAVAFFEGAAGFPPEVRFAHSEDVTAIVKELQLEVSKNKGRPHKRAKQILVSMVCAWEEIVMQEDIPIFPRAYAWLKLTGVWASLRSDDILGIDPLSIKLDEAGLTMKLLRTKTSGPGKKDEVLTAYVSAGAYLVHPGWIKVGVQLWKALHFDRDFFLGPPSRDLSRMLPSVASYEDRSAMTKALATYMLSLQATPLFHSHHAYFFWTEHSPRATVPTWAALANIPKEVRRRLGRWKSPAEECEELYVRQEKMLVVKTQNTLADMIRQFGSLQEGQPKPDVLGENEVLDELEVFLKNAGVGEDDVLVTIENLRFFDRFTTQGSSEQAPHSPPQELGDEVGDTLPDSMVDIAPADFYVGEDPTQDQQGDEADFVEDSEWPQDEEAAGALIAKALDKAEADRVLSEAGFKGFGEISDPEDEEVWEPEDVPGQLDYVISISGKKGFRRLHRVGWCWRTPSMDYKVASFSTEPPPLGTYDALCKQCWPGQDIDKDMTPAALSTATEPGSPSTSSSSGMSDAEVESE